MVETLLLTTARVSTFIGQQLLTGASGFFFERDGRLFFVTSRHVMYDEPTKHFPDRVEIEMHADARDLTRTVVLSVLLYENGKAVWRQGSDGAGPVDVAMLEIDRAVLPGSAVVETFTLENLKYEPGEVEVGNSLLVVGFPLGFYDTVHHLPVVRQAVIASAFGVRFQGQGFFLTDARTHRGTSGAPVVMRSAHAGSHLPWKLLGVHSARIDMGNRDLELDESLGLNSSWYADILMTLSVASA